MKKDTIVLKKKIIPIWLLATLLVLSGAGAAAGIVLPGDVSIEVPVAVSQAILVDGMGLGVDDVTYGDGTSLNRAFAAATDQSTAFQVAAEISTGDKFLISLPIKNASENPMMGLITLEPSSPAGLQLDVDERSLLALTHVTSPPEDAAARGAQIALAGTYTYNTQYWPLADSDGDGNVDTSDVIMTPAGGGAATVNSVNALTGQITYTITGNVTALTVDYWYGSEITMLAQVGPNQWKFQADGSVGTNKSGDIEIIVAHPDGLAPAYYRIKGTIEQIKF